MRNNKVKWYGKIPLECDWLTFVEIVGKGYEYSKDLKNIIVTSDDNKGLPDDILVQTKPTNQHAIRQCTIHFKQEKIGDNPILTKDILITQEGINETCVVNNEEPIINYSKSILRVEPKNNIINFYKGEFNGIKAYLKPYYIQKTLTKYCGTDEIISSGTVETYGDEINVSNDSLCVWQVSDPQCNITINNDSATLNYSLNTETNEKNIIVTATYNNTLNDTCNFIQGVQPAPPSEESYFYEVRTNVKDGNVIFSSKLTDFERTIKAVKENDYYKARIELPKTIAEKNSPIIVNVTNKLPDKVYGDINLLLSNNNENNFSNNITINNINCNESNAITILGKCYCNVTNYSYSNNNTEIKPNTLSLIMSGTTNETINVPYKGISSSNNVYEYGNQTLTIFNNWNTLSYKLKNNDTEVTQNYTINYESEEVNGKKGHATLNISQLPCPKTTKMKYFDFRILFTHFLKPNAELKPINKLVIEYKIGDDIKTATINDIKYNYQTQYNQQEDEKYMLYYFRVDYDENLYLGKTIKINKIEYYNSTDNKKQEATFFYEKYVDSQHNYVPITENYVNLSDEFTYVKALISQKLNNTARL